MKKRVLILLFVAISMSGIAQRYRTQSFTQDIKTVKAEIVGKPLFDPIIELNGSERILISFDEMSYETKSYNYAIVHCNADWTASDLSEIEYIDGHSTNYIDNAEQSTNTVTLYTNYQLELPNDEIRFKCSGNYAVVIYEDGDRENVKATACFSIVESRIGIDASVKGNTDIEINNRYQQLEFSINHEGMRVTDPINDFKIVVRQNGRRDNEVIDIKPTYTTTYKQTYSNNKQLIFEGGNEYRVVDFSSEYTYGNGIERIVYDGDIQHVIIEQDNARNKESYGTSVDAAGKYVVHRQNAEDDYTEADYMWVHFTLPLETPMFSGSIYLCGEIMGNELQAKDRMDYNAETNCYEKALLLKQGGINYLYLYVPKGGKSGSTLPIEGSHWQTKNNYQILVYYRPRGERYDRLIGVKTISS